MAQHDYSIANGTGSAVRSDLNDALAAIVSLNSGATEPATTFAFQLWADTTANVLKLRNSANNAWITLRQLDGDFTTVSVDNGTAAAPSVFFNASGTDTGFYSSGTDAVDVSTAGTRRLGVGSAGDVTVFGGNVTLNAQGDLRFADSDSSNWVAFQAPATVASNVTWTLPSADGTADQALVTNGSGTLSWADAGGTSDAITEGNTSAEVVDTGGDGHFKVVTEGNERARINSVGKFLVGTSTARTTFFNDSITPHVQIEGYDEATSSLSIYSNENNSNGPYLFLGKGRGGSVGSTTQVSDGDRLGSLQFAGLDQQGHVMCAAEIFAEVDGTPAQSGEDMPGRLMFFTMPNASGTTQPTERMRITNSGFIKVSNSGSYPDGTNDNTGHYFNHNRTANPVLFIRADSSSYGETGEGALYVLVNRNTTNNSFNIATFTNGNGTGKCYIRDNGDLENTNNSYTGISDVKLKENIVDANSQWDDIKALEFKTYNLIAKPDERHIGVIAQQVEQVSPGLVRDTRDFDADGNDLGTVTKSVKYSILYTKAVKALQEAMERIETLETANASLEARLTALENA